MTLILLKKSLEDKIISLIIAFLGNSLNLPDIMPINFQSFSFLIKSSLTSYTSMVANEKKGADWAAAVYLSNPKEKHTLTKWEVGWFYLSDDETPITVGYVAAVGNNGENEAVNVATNALCLLPLSSQQILCNPGDLQAFSMQFSKFLLHFSIETIFGLM
ncbi:hypothetical protein FF38_04241 [Lucilia cuprina]|uniref:Uncharacterized protein n=1 Tax=Lucilia cuprina TaxID=7375 RepID=A0A0L0C190_LUCCU|nr:hypothetical protein FF38_04241 [Lucilia cuprina]